MDSNSDIRMTRPRERCIRVGHHYYSQAKTTISTTQAFVTRVKMVVKQSIAVQRYILWGAPAPFEASVCKQWT